MPAAHRAVRTTHRLPVGSDSARQAASSPTLGKYKTCRLCASSLGRRGQGVHPAALEGKSTCPVARS
eukprot:9851772-Heterocapsa_arctica.AAC.1